MSADVSAQRYFAQALPWQDKAWRQLTEQFSHQQLPHGLLAAGAKGIGKHAFVWRFVAYLLCMQPTESGACGNCDSCKWLKAGTHPDLMVLPEPAEGESVRDSIKIDDIRRLQEYSQTKGHGAKVMVLDGADTLTLGAANALLKTLEEPRDGVFLILISDHPSRLLPTIKSRVQTIPLSQIDQTLALSYLSEQMDADTAQMLLELSDGAVLQAQRLWHEDWFHQRALWLKTFAALNRGTRLPMAASEYWQKTLSLQQFILLSRMMLVALWRHRLALPNLHRDLDIESLLGGLDLDNHALERLLASLDDVEVSIIQNVQEKLAYDQLMLMMAGQSSVS